MKPEALQPFRFMAANGRGFKLVVLAPSLKAARDHVRREASSVIAYRALRFVGEGHPANPEFWCAALVRRGGATS